MFATQNGRVTTWLSTNGNHKTSKSVCISLINHDIVTSHCFVIYHSHFHTNMSQLLGKWNCGCISQRVTTYTLFCNIDEDTSANKSLPTANDAWNLDEMQSHCVLKCWLVVSYRILICLLWCVWPWLSCRYTKQSTIIRHMLVVKWQWIWHQCKEYIVFQTKLAQREKLYNSNIVNILLTQPSINISSYEFEQSYQGL